ncbi:IS110 family transposase [Cupriavidus sp. UYPR2.512]|uniref:IS110 family transposase n=1 Tax=Cupriavidus sp. UYPR2.512 TaxID=1080187 RepID=UPI001E2E0038|nr:IS110 family transposase [Cupriavidus sp. UYPR2.512]
MNKKDVADAEAICEAVARPNMRFVPVKNIDQQAVLALHRSRQGFVRARTAQANQIRGLLGEFGLVIPRGITNIAQHVPAASNELPGSFRLLVQRLIDHLKELDRQVEELETQIKAWHHANDATRRLAEIPGIGPITASALVASIGEGKCFSNARQLAAWLGLVPRQHSSGGKPLLLGITKRGDTYLRTLMRPRSTSRRSLRHKQKRRVLWLAPLAVGKTPQEDRRGGSGQQECANCLGTAHTRPYVSIGLRVVLEDVA